MEYRRNQITAFRICEKIPLKALNNIEEVLRAEITYRSAEQIELKKDDATIYIFNFGIIAFFNLETEDQEETLTSFLSEFSSVISGIEQDISSVSDSLKIRFGEENKIDFDSIYLTGTEDDYLRIVALVLSHSVMLDYYEHHVDNLLELSTTQLIDSKQSGWIPRGVKKLRNFLVECMQTKQNIITNLFVLDAPEEVWENPELDKLYQGTRKMLDISLRFKALDYKLKLTQENLTMILNMVSSRSGFWMELIIVLLILTEILMAIAKLA
jgi:required for meiotic nuclear division protein 1